MVARTLKEGMTPIRAWREYLQLIQADMAERLAISQSAYAAGSGRTSAQGNP